jgi:hypothetical protein
MSASVDASTRMVLPEDAPYLRNLAALFARQPALAAAIESLPDEPAYSVVTARDGNPTVAVPTEDGRTIWLHSRHRPADEARKFVEELDTDGKEVAFLHGLGLGYHAQALLDRAPGAELFIIETDLELIRAACWSRDLADLLDSPRVFLLWQHDKDAFTVALQPHVAAIHLGNVSIEHPASVQRCPARVAEHRRWIDEFIDYARTTVNTMVLNGKRTCENVCNNLPLYVSSPSVGRLRDAYAGYPAIVVSAGPSLRKNKHLLPSAAGKAVIVAVQTTFKPLLEIGVEPDFVTSLDYHDISTRFYENLPRGCRSELVAEPKATSLIFELHPGPITLNGNEFAEKLLRELRLRKDSLPGGATVAHLAYYLSEHLGCDPIIFVGQDLGFSDGLCYSPGTSYDDVWRPELGRFCTVEMKQWEQIVRDRPILRRVEDFHGNPTYTEARLFSYLQQFERDFARSRKRIIDATEGGVRKRGAEPMTLADAIERFCTRPLPQGRPVARLRPDLLASASDCLRARLDEAEQIGDIARRTRPLLERVRDALGNTAVVNATIAEIDALRARMATLAMTFELVMQLTQPTEIRRYLADRRIDAEKLQGIERQRRQVQRDIDNVEAVIASSEQFVRLMRKTIERMDQAAGRVAPGLGRAA